MYEILDDNQVNDMYSRMYNKQKWDNVFSRKLPVLDMCNVLDEKYLEDGNKYFQKIKENAYTAMNDYTHTGANQISRNFDEDGKLISNFSESMINDSLEDIYFLTKVFSQEYLKNIALKQEIITNKYLIEFIERY